MATNSEVNITIAGDGARLDRSLSDAQKKLEGFQKRVESANKFSLERLARAGLLMSASVNALDIASKALTGDITEAAEAAKKLPLGVGQMATALESVLGKWTGITAEIERMTQQQKALNAITQAGLAAIEARAKALKDFRERADATNAQAGMIGKSGAVKAFGSARSERDKALKDVDARLRAGIEAARKAQNDQIAAIREMPVDPRDVDTKTGELLRSTGRKKFTGAETAASRAAAEAIVRAEQARRMAGGPMARYQGTVGELQRAADQERAAIRNKYGAQMDEMARKSLTGAVRGVSGAIAGGLKNAAGSVGGGLDLLVAGLSNERERAQKRAVAQAALARDVSSRIGVEASQTLVDAPGRRFADAKQDQAADAAKRSERWLASAVKFLDEIRKSVKDWKPAVVDIG